MSDLSAIRADFVGIKHVKGRGMMQIIVEVPVEQANQALNALGGLPINGETRWVALARIYDGVNNGNT